LLLVAKHYSGRDLWRNGWRILVAQTLWGGVALRHGRGRAFLRGKIEGFRMLRQMRRDAAWEVVESGRLSRVLAESEADIRESQRQSGFERYWRWYFTLT
jgi:hypothetical protein